MPLCFLLEQPAPAETKPLPVALLTGFLGSGKTSFLRRVLADPELPTPRS